MATVNQTTIVVPGRPSFTVPGNLTTAQVRSSFGTELGLTSMESSERTEGSTRFVEFKHRTGNKGA